MNVALATRCARLPHWAAELVMFILKQGWACLFRGLMLIGIIASKAIWQDGWALARYDGLFLYVLPLQITFLALKLESWREARVILLFHIIGTAMEIFKVQAGSWAYPETGLIKLMGVPLFSGFMYASVGSCMAGIIRIFDMRFTPYPPFWMTVLLACAIYVNFFAHHFLPDIRLALFAATLILYFRTRIQFTIGANTYWMPCRLPPFLAASFCGSPKTSAPTPAHGFTRGNQPNFTGSALPNSAHGIYCSTSALPP